MISPEMKERIYLLVGQGATLYPNYSGWLNGLSKDTKGKGLIASSRNDDIDRVWREMFQKHADKAYPSQRRIVMANGQEILFAFEPEHLIGLASENLHIWVV